MSSIIKEERMRKAIGRRVNVDSGFGEGVLSFYGKVSAQHTTASSPLHNTHTHTPPPHTPVLFSRSGAYSLAFARVLMVPPPLHVHQVGAKGEKRFGVSLDDPVGKSSGLYVASPPSVEAGLAHEAYAGWSTRAGYRLFAGTYNHSQYWLLISILPLE
jgi:hypothetical protein